MKYTKYDPTEINTIANKYLNNEFIQPAGKEAKKWHDYRNSIKNDILDIKEYLKIVETTEHEDDWEEHEITKTARKKLEEAKTELKWVRSIPTYNLEAFCKYWIMRTDSHDAHMQPRLIHMLAERVVTGDATKTDKQFVKELFEESEYASNVRNFQKITSPVTLRNWEYEYNRPTEYYPTETPCDATHLYDGREHYVYFQNKNQARWGESYWISVDCDNILYSLPIIKAFKEYDFEVGKFYKIKCIDEIRWGNNKRKYIMEIKETTEEEFMEKGLIQYATRY